MEYRDDLCKKKILGLDMLVDNAGLVCDTKSHNIRVKVQYIDQVPDV